MTTIREYVEKSGLSLDDAILIQEDDSGAGGDYHFGYLSALRDLLQSSLTDVVIETTGTTPLIVRRDTNTNFAAILHEYEMKNSAGEWVDYARLIPTIVDNTDGSEDGRLDFHVVTNGVDGRIFRLLGTGSRLESDFSVAGLIEIESDVVSASSIPNSIYRTTTDFLVINGGANGFILKDDAGSQNIILVDTFGGTTFSTDTSIQNAGLETKLIIDNTGSGDSVTRYRIGGLTKGMVGVDNSDSDKLKIALTNLSSPSVTFSSDLSSEFAGDIITTGGQVSVTETDNRTTGFFKNENAGLTGSVVFARTTRTNSTDFNLFIGQTNNGGDTEFRVRGNGDVNADGAFTGGGADYAEYFEWEDGNPNSEDRSGLAVVLVGDKIREAQEGEIPFGVISANPSIVGDADIDQWKGKYLRDDFGAYVREPYEVVEWEEVIPAVTEKTPRTWDKPVMIEVEEPVPAVTSQKAIINDEGEAEIVEVEIEPATTKMVEVQKVETVEEMVNVPEQIVEGVLIPEHEELQEVEKPVFETSVVVDQQGNPVVDEVEIEAEKTIKHSYEADKVPEGVSVPEDATRINNENGQPLTRRVLNADYDESFEYIPRSERPEWSTVGLMGKLRLRKGQPVAPSWVKMRDVGESGVEEWLVR
jgi:hypothetical protein